MINVDRRAALAALGAGWLAACGGIGGGLATDDSTGAAPSSPTGPTVAAYDGEASYGDFAAASLGAGAALNGALAFPADNAWNADIRSAPVDPNSDALIASIGLGVGLHPDFGAGLYNGAPIGIPYVVVSGSQPRVAMTWTAYGGESETGPFPIPANAPVEGGSALTNTGDRHVLVIDRDNDRLYELFNAICNAGRLVGRRRRRSLPPRQQHRATGRPARLDQRRRGRPADLPRARPLRRGRARARRHPPCAALHGAADPRAPMFRRRRTGPRRTPTRAVPPMGMRVRLKSSYAIPASFSRETRALLTAMQTHGMIVADHGSNWYVSGAPDERWNNNALVSELRQVTGQHFEVVRMSGVVAG